MCPALDCGSSWPWPHFMSQPKAHWLWKRENDGGLTPIGARGNSYFRIGWDWVKTALLNGWRLIRHVSFTDHRDPDPVMASRKQHEKRTYRH
ncbi:hypothetical protein [Moorena producens]|uniref:hypothetical protein n=2 Tax=Coleofasciculaceae TaxID=1892251 RepID=UPI001E463210|nr:hypothetical protein [Moorena producens]